MATYKVIQDIEAEDKLLGPLTLRQFIYAAIVAVSGFVCFKLAFSSVWWLIILFIPHIVLFSMLAAPFGHDQPSEVWLLAKIRFFLKPRRRIWDQDGMKELVTINAPKKVEKQLTDNLTQTEVKSRLEALANTIDSRGWAIKNLDVNMYTSPTYAQQGASSDRLIDIANFPQEVPSFDTQAVSDMFDESTSPTAQNLTQLMNASTQAHRKEVMKMMQQGGQPAAPVSMPTNQAQSTKGKKVTFDQQAPPPDYWFMNGTAGQTPALRPGYATFDHNPVVAPGMDGVVNTAPMQQVNATGVDEQQLLEQIHKEQSRPNPMNSRLKTIQPLSHTPSGTYAVDDPTQQNNDQDQAHAANQQDDSYAADNTTQYDPANSDDSTTTDYQQNDSQNETPVRDAAILRLASNDDLNVATLAREASKARQLELSSDDEVVISLH